MFDLQSHSQYTYKRMFKSAPTEFHGAAALLLSRPSLVDLAQRQLTQISLHCMMLDYFDHVTWSPT